VDFIEDQLRRLAEAGEAHDPGKDGDDEQGDTGTSLPPIS